MSTRSIVRIVPKNTKTQHDNQLAAPRLWLARHRLKTLLLAVVSVILTTACASKEERAAQMAERTQQVEAALQKQHYKIDIQTMTPRQGGSRQVSYGFSLQVKGDTLVSYLPYFGRAYSVPYAGTGKGLNFTERIREYAVERARKGQTLIRLRVQNEEDNYLFTILVFDSGEADIDLQPRERESIRYSGELSFDD